MMKINEEKLLNDRQLREQNIERYEILEKVKELLLIPGTELATVQQVADFYEVGKEAIQSLVKDNRDEVLEDGLLNCKGKETKEILEKSFEDISNFRGGFMAAGIRFSNRGNLLFTRRAILRVGMLLRDSVIAREIRTQLLNIEEKSSDDAKTADIDEEQTLMLSVGMAYASGDINAVMTATTNYTAFQKRHITKLETTNKALANGILKWEDRSNINFAVRKLAKVTRTSTGKMWNELYKQLKYKYHIDVKARADKDFISTIKENEWEYVIKSFSALCKLHDQEPADMFNDKVIT